VNGQVTGVDPMAAALNPATPTEDVHMLVAAYVCTGFLVASVYSAGALRGRWDEAHRRGLAAGMSMALLAIGLAGITGDSSARFVYTDQPAKFASMEGLYRTVRGAPIHIGGIPLNSQQRVVFGIEIPRGLSLLAAFDPNAEVKGLNEFAAADRPNPILVHLSFDTMVGLGLGLGLLALVFWGLAWRSRAIPNLRPLIVALVVSGPAAVVAMEAGWFVTEFGRQPWVVYGILRTADAATPARGLLISLVAFLLVYVALAVTGSRLLLLLAERRRQTP